LTRIDSSGTFAGSYNKALALSALIISFGEEKKNRRSFGVKTARSALIAFANDFISKKVEGPCFSAWFVFLISPLSAQSSGG
jgi:hypothetical protein